MTVLYRAEMLSGFFGHWHLSAFYLEFQLNGPCPSHCCTKVMFQDISISPDSFEKKKLIWVSSVYS